MATAGSGQQKQTAAAGLNNITNGQNLESQAGKLSASETNLNGGLSPLLSRQLAGESANISKAYTGAAAANARGLAQRGMGAAPSGMNASLMNSAANGAGQAQSQATTGAFGAQNSLNNAAMQNELGAQNATSGAIGASTGANTALNNMPTTMGNIMGGLSGLSGVAKNVLPFTGLGPQGGGGGSQ